MLIKSDLRKYLFWQLLEGLFQPFHILCADNHAPIVRTGLRGCVSCSWSDVITVCLLNKIAISTARQEETLGRAGSSSK